MYYAIPQLASDCETTASTFELWEKKTSNIGTGMVLTGNWLPAILQHLKYDVILLQELLQPIQQTCSKTSPLTHKLYQLLSLFNPLYLRTWRNEWFWLPEHQRCGGTENGVEGREKGVEGAKGETIERVRVFVVQPQYLRQIQLSFTNCASSDATNRLFLPVHR